MTRTLQLGVERKVCPGIEVVVFWSAAIAIVGYLGWEWLAAGRRRRGETPPHASGGASRHRRAAGPTRSGKRTAPTLPVWRVAYARLGGLVHVIPDGYPQIAVWRILP